MTPRRARGHGRLAGLAAAWATVALAAFVIAPRVPLALVIDAGDGLGNTTPPPELAGWDNVGRRLGGPSVVYVGNRWVLTADHVGAGVVVIAGRRYDPEPDNITRLVNDDGSPADLLLFRIEEDPGLAPLRIARLPPRIGQDVVLVGMGASRGALFTVRSPRDGLLDGFEWVADGTKRWGTNLVAGTAQRVQNRDGYTWAIPMIFDRIDDPLGTKQEATAASGDSGGALFALEDALAPERGYVLSGVLFSVSNLPEQPRETSLYGSATYAADLSSYRDQILATMSRDCAGGRGDETGCATAGGDGSAWRGTLGTRAALSLSLLAGAAVGLLVWWLAVRARARHSGVT